VLYGTTPTFLERLGLHSIDDLPPLGEFFPGPDVVEALERGLRVVDGDSDVDDSDVDDSEISGQDADG
jgi:segregation and condensation protein B